MHHEKTACNFLLKGETIYYYIKRIITTASFTRAKHVVPDIQQQTPKIDISEADSVVIRLDLLMLYIYVLIGIDSHLSTATTIPLGIDTVTTTLLILLTPLLLLLLGPFPGR